MALGVSPSTVQRSLRATPAGGYRGARSRVLAESTARLMKGWPAPSVKQVAAALGYRSPQAFARAFRRVSGRPPTGSRQPTGQLTRTEPT